MLCKHQKEMMRNIVVLLGEVEFVDPVASYYELK